MIAIERDNPWLKNTLPKEYARPHLDKQSLGGIIDLISTIDFKPSPVASRHPLPSDGRGAGGEGDHRSKDILGRVFDPCCGSGGMFVQSVEFVNAHANGSRESPARITPSAATVG